MATIDPTALQESASVVEERLREAGASEAAIASARWLNEAWLRDPTASRCPTAPLLEPLTSEQAGTIAPFQATVECLLFDEPFFDLVNSEWTSEPADVVVKHAAERQVAEPPPTGAMSKDTSQDSVAGDCNVRVFSEYDSTDDRIAYRVRLRQGEFGIGRLLARDAHRYGSLIDSERCIATLLDGESRNDRWPAGVARRQVLLTWPDLFVPPARLRRDMGDSILALLQVGVQAAGSLGAQVLTGKYRERLRRELSRWMSDEADDDQLGRAASDAIGMLRPLLYQQPCRAALALAGLAALILDNASIGMFAYRALRVAVTQNTATAHEVTVLSLLADRVEATVRISDLDEADARSPFEGKRARRITLMDKGTEYPRDYLMLSHELSLECRVEGQSALRQRLSRADGWQDTSDVMTLQVTRVLATCGDSSAMFALARAYEHGIGVGRDHLHSLRWLCRAAHANHADAMNKLGSYLFNSKSAPDYEAAAGWFRKAAALGSIHAMLNLGICYGSGRGVPQDDAVAVKWYRSAAESGVVTAMFQLGEHCAAGRGIERDHASAFEWYRKAANAGHVEASYKAGQCLKEGVGTSENAALAVVCFRKAAQANHVEAMASLGACLGDGIGVAKDGPAAAEWLRKAAEAGHINAMNALGEMCRSGMGIARDLDAALAWFRKAAEGGSVHAMMRLGDHYAGDQFRYSLGPLDCDQAAHWFLKAAYSGYGYAWCRLAELVGTIPVLHFKVSDKVVKSLGVTTASEAHVLCYQKGAEAGLVEAHYKLGEIFDAGRHVTRNVAEAAEWFRKAAEGGHVAAMRRLGECFACGAFGKVNGATAVMWFRRAADAGDAAAAMAMGKIYEEGCGVEQDIDAAIDCYRRAAESKGSSREALFKVGELLEETDGDRDRSAEAFVWLRRAADAGHVEAMTRIAVRYATGQGTTVDVATAVEWFGKAASRGSAAAMCELGVRHAEGDGIGQDEVKAFAWLNDACSRGHGRARIELSQRYAPGYENGLSSTEALKWKAIAEARGVDAAIRWASRRRRALRTLTEPVANGVRFAWVLGPLVMTWFASGCLPPLLFLVFVVAIVKSCSIH